MFSKRLRVKRLYQIINFHLEVVMTSKSDTLAERERIKDIIDKKIESHIQYRQSVIKNKRRQAISVFERLREDIFFLIDNPNYKTKPRHT